MTLPNFLIVGAPRCGTTTLNFHLRNHPDVYTPSVKEVHFFDQQWSRGLAWYESMFEGSESYSRRGEVTPHYLADPRAMRRLDATLPAVDIIAILRDPVDRANSHFNYRRARGLAEGSFEEAIEHELSGKTGAFPYVEVGRYSAHLEGLASLTGSHRQLILWHQELQGDAGTVLRRLSEFLKIPTFQTSAAARVNASDSFRSIRLRNFAKQLPKPVQRCIGRLNRREVAYPRPPTRIRTAIVDALRSDTERLQAQTGQDLSSWLL